MERDLVCARLNGRGCRRGRKCVWVLSGGRGAASRVGPLATVQHLAAMLVSSQRYGRGDSTVVTSSFASRPRDSPTGCSCEMMSHYSV